MEEMIRALIDIEQNARTAELNALDKKNKLPERIEKARKDIEKRINDEAEEKIQRMRDRILLESNEQAAGISAKANESFKLMEKEFNENHERWENEIFNSIIGR